MVQERDSLSLSPPYQPPPTRHLLFFPSCYTTYHLSSQRGRKGDLKGTRKGGEGGPKGKRGSKEESKGLNSQLFFFFGTVNSSSPLI